MRGCGKLDQQWRNGDYSKSVRCEPVLPSRQNRGRRAVKQFESDSSTDPRDGRPYDRRCGQPQHVAQLVQSEIRTEIILNEPCREHGFTCITKCGENSAPEIPVAEEISHDCSNHSADNDWPSRARSERDEDAGRHTSSRPKNSNALRLGQQGKTKPRCGEIYDADKDRESDRANPLRQGDAGGPLT